MFYITKHARRRMAQRNLSLKDIEYVFTHGRPYHRAGALIYYLRKRDLPDWDLPEDRWQRLAGTAVVLTKDGRVVITAWRDVRSGLKKIKRKCKYELTD